MSGHGFRPVAALSWSSIQGVWQSKLVMLALVFSVVHIGIRAAIIVFVSVLAPQQVDTFLNATFLRNAVVLQATLPAVIVLGAVGTRTATRDRLMGGLEFLLSKSLSRWGYVAARSLGPLLVAVVLVLLPVVLLVAAIATLVTPLPEGAGGLLWGAIGMGAVVSLALGPMAAGLGSLVEDLRSATGLWLAVAWATIPLQGFLRTADIGWAWALAPVVAVDGIAGTLIGLRFTGGEELYGWLYVAGMVLVPLLLLYYRTREVYG